jgi:predicted histidine transporter YuiF (NhaC family)
MTDQYTESNTPFFTTAAKHGLIMAVLAIIITLAMQLAGLGSNMMLTMLVGFLVFFLYIFAGYRAVKEHRDVELGGQITFARAFVTALVATLLACLIASLFSVIYTVYIDPASAQQNMDAARDMMENLGADEDAIDEALRKAEEQMSNPVGLFIQTFATAGIISAIGSAIIAAVLKRNAPTA